MKQDRPHDPIFINRQAVPYMVPNGQQNRIRTSPLCIAIATAVATVFIATAFIFSAWRLIIDANQYFLGTPMSDLGVWALIWVQTLFVLPISFIVLALCIDRCQIWWLGFPTFFCSILATLSFAFSPALRHFLPIGFIAEGTDSSERWYSGAIFQLLIASWLLRWFRRPRTHSDNS